MLPSSASLLNLSFDFTEAPSKTYQMNLQTEDKVQGYTDGLAAMKQAIYKILMTERYRYVMYSWNYGVELADLLGQPVSYACPEIERRITEALLWDKRIQKVTDFEFDVTKKNIVHTSFTVHTIFGEILAEKEVTI